MEETAAQIVQINKGNAEGLHALSKVGGDERLTGVEKTRS